jgi:hypothetical protein
MNCPICQAGCCLDHAAAPDPYIPPPPASGPRLMRAWPPHVLAFLRRYTRAAAEGDMLAAVEARRGWPDGLHDCSCLTGEVEGPDGRAYTCSKCGGVGLYYQPESDEVAA